MACSAIVAGNRLMTAGGVSERIYSKGTFVPPVEVHLMHFVLILEWS